VLPALQLVSRLGNEVAQQSTTAMRPKDARVKRRKHGSSCLVFKETGSENRVVADQQEESSLDVG
jgi:hypothetical protein